MGIAIAKTRETPPAHAPLLPSPLPRPPLDPTLDPPCERAAKATPEQMEGYFKIAKADLERQGIAFDASVWSDPDKFARYMAAFSKAAGCSS